MNSCQKSRMIFISIQLLYLFHAPGIVCDETENKKLDKPPKDSKFATLPLVLLREEGKYEYSFPRCFRRSSDHKLVDFKATNEKKETVYFCPKSSEDRLLSLADDQNYIPCATQPKPILRKDKEKNNCGENKDFYTYGYKLDNGEADSFSWKEIYSFCYDTKNEEVSYLRYRMISPNLLKNRHLQDIRSYFERVFRIEETEDEYLNAYVNLIMQTPTTPELHKHFMAMELGHPADMIFPNWKKPFYYAANQGLLLHQLKHQWRKIGYFIRKLAEKKLGEIEIMTGTFEFPNKLLFGTFWKLVIYKDYAIAIILHNIYEERPKEEINVDGPQPSENNTNTTEKLPQKNDEIDEGPEKKTEPPKIPTNKHQHPTKEKAKDLYEEYKKKSKAVGKPNKKETKVVDEASKKEPDVVGETSKKEPVVLAEPSKKEPDVVGETSKKNTVNKDKDESMQIFCEDICDKMGFGGVISRELMYPAYCCKPEIILEKLGLPNKYEVLDLRKTPKDRSVTDDDCPKDPLQTSTTEGETPTEDSNKIEKS